MNAWMCFSFSLLVVLLSGCSVSDTEAEAATHMTKSRLDMACSSIEIYREDQGYFPSADKGLESLIKRDGLPSNRLIFIDGWKRPLRPVVSNFSIVGAYSVGINGEDEGGGGDDISCRRP
jgi:hypothetical protein